MDPKQLSIVGMPFVIGLGVTACACFVAAAIVARRAWLRVVAGLAGLGLMVATIGAGINAYYDYFPTLGALLGRTAADQISISHFRNLERVTRDRVGSALLGFHHLHVPRHGV